MSKAIKAADYEMCEECHARTNCLRNERCRDCYRRLAHLREFLAGWFWHLHYRYMPVWTTRGALDERMSARFIEGATYAMEENAVPASPEVRRHASRQLANGATLVAVE